MFTNAEIIAVGTELLLGQIVNTNARDLAQSLAANGVNLFFQSVVGDNPGRMAQSLRIAQSRADLVVLTGGLGPTMDDITKEVLADTLGRKMVWDESLWQSLMTHFSRTGRAPSENNRRQAWVIEGASVLENPYGTAPGLAVENEGKVFILLPGPPREMSAMWNEKALPFLKQRGYIGAEVIHSRIVRVCGLGESAAEEKVKDLIASCENLTIAPYAGGGEVQFRVTAKDADHKRASALVDKAVELLCERLGDNVFGVDADSLEAALGRRLKSLGLSVSVAESCTGGLLGHRITSVAGSSDYFLGGIIAYSNDVKRDVLGVRPETLAEHGAVSKETALEMAEGVRQILGTSIGIAVTGIAGPDGGSPEKPVGTVHFGFAVLDRTFSSCSLFRPPRADIQWRAARYALTGLWLHLGALMEELPRVL